MEEIKELIEKTLKYEEESYMPHYGTIDNLRLLLTMAEERIDDEKVSK
jgi:hypothetical protein